MNIIIQITLVDVEDKRKCFILCSLSTGGSASPDADSLCLERLMGVKFQHHIKGER